MRFDPEDFVAALDVRLVDETGVTWRVCPCCTALLAHTEFRSEYSLTCLVCYEAAKARQPRAPRVKLDKAAGPG